VLQSRKHDRDVQLYAFACWPATATTTASEPEAELARFTETLLVALPVSYQSRYPPRQEPKNDRAKPRSPAFSFLAVNPTACHCEILAPGLGHLRREAFPRPEDELLGKFAVEFTNLL